VTLRENQAIFAGNLARLILHAESIGKQVFIAELYRTPEHQQMLSRTGKSKTLKSKHCLGLAMDLYLLSDVQDDGVIKATKADYQALGDYWQSLDPACTWGGNWSFADFVHFSCDSVNPETRGRRTT